jgi:hypothetical protein
VSLPVIDRQSEAPFFNIPFSQAGSPMIKHKHFESAFYSLIMEEGVIVFPSGKGKPGRIRERRIRWIRKKRM